MLPSLSRLAALSYGHSYYSHMALVSQNGLAGAPAISSQLGCASATAGYKATRTHHRQVRIHGREPVYVSLVAGFGHRQSHRPPPQRLLGVAGARLCSRFDDLAGHDLPQSIHSANSFTLNLQFNQPISVALNRQSVQPQLGCSIC